MPHRSDRLLVCDGNSLAYRAWFALAKTGLDGPWVTHGVASMLATAWDEHGPFDALILAFDTQVNHRKQRWPEYKANREERDPQLYAQIDQLRAILQECALPTVVCDGWEADDLVASAAKRAARAGAHAYVLTSDRDLLGCVADTCTVLRVTSSVRTAKAYTPERVAAEYGVAPDLYHQFAALRGDPSDGLAGVDGVGEKTAARLLGRFGDGAALYEQLDAVGGKLAGKLADGRANYERNIELMTLNTALDVDVEGALAAGVDIDVAAAALARHGLHSASRRFARLLRGEQLPPIPPPPDEPPPELDAYDDAPIPEDVAAVFHQRPDRSTGEQPALF